MQNVKVSTNSVLQNNTFHLHSCARESSKEEPPGKTWSLGRFLKRGRFVLDIRQDGTVGLACSAIAVGI